MALFRRLIFWCHLAAGLVAGSIVLVMSATGVLLTYERQITDRAETRAFRAAPADLGASRLAPSALIAAVRSWSGRFRLQERSPSAR